MCFVNAYVCRFVCVCVGRKETNPAVTTYLQLYLIDRPLFAHRPDEFLFLPLHVEEKKTKNMEEKMKRMKFDSRQPVVD